MEILYTTPNGRIQIKQELAKPKDAFQFLGVIQEMLEEEKCGCCGSVNIRCEVREVDDYKYYQLTCQEQDCHARLEFGQHKNEKTLFAKRWDTERKAPMPDKGWFVWKPDSEDDNRPAYQNSSQGQRPAGRAPMKESAAHNEVPW